MMIEHISSEIMNDSEDNTSKKQLPQKFECGNRNSNGQSLEKLANLVNTMISTRTNLHQPMWIAQNAVRVASSAKLSKIKEVQKSGVINANAALKPIRKFACTKTFERQVAGW